MSNTHNVKKQFCLYNKSRLETFVDTGRTVYTIRSSKRERKPLYGYGPKGRAGMYIVGDIKPNISMWMKWNY